MKIIQIKSMTKLTTLYVIALTLLNLWAQVLYILRSEGLFLIVTAVLTILLIGFVVAILLWKQTQVKNGEFYLYIVGNVVYSHGLSVCHRPNIRVFLNLEAFVHFSVKKGFLFSEYLCGKKRNNGKTVMLLNSGIYDKTSSEIAAIFNQSKGPVVAAYREDDDSQQGAIVS